MVVREGIEPPTRGLSVRHWLLRVQVYSLDLQLKQELARKQAASADGWRTLAEALFGPFVDHNLNADRLTLSGHFTEP